MGPLGLKAPGPRPARRLGDPRQSLMPPEASRAQKALQACPGPGLGGPSTEVTTRLLEPGGPSPSQEGLEGLK